jgi:hypothetical protein
MFFTPSYFPVVEFNFRVYFAFGNNRLWGPPASDRFLVPGHLSWVVVHLVTMQRPLIVTPLGTKPAPLR